MLPETLEGLLIPAVLAGVLWSLIGVVLFYFRVNVSPEDKRNIMLVLTVLSGGLIALYGVLPPETQQSIANIYLAIRPLLDLILRGLLAAGTAWVANQAWYRLMVFVDAKR